MTYIEVKYDTVEQKWVAMSVSDGDRVHRCAHEDREVLLDEVSNWSRLLQAEVRIIKG